MFLNQFLPPKLTVNPNKMQGFNANPVLLTAFGVILQSEKLKLNKKR
jgi:hypothetical protein